MRITLQTWHQDAPLHHLSVYQISRQSNNLFPRYGNQDEKKKKNEETKPIFESSYLGNAWRDLVEIWNARYWRWRASPPQKSSSFVQAAQSYVYVKIVVLFFLLIYSQVWHASFLGRTTHYHVSWFQHNKNLSLLLLQYTGHYYDFTTVNITQVDWPTQKHI